MRLQIVKMRFWRRLGGLYGGTWGVLAGSWAVKLSVSGAGRRVGGAGLDEVFEEEESERVCKVV